MTKIELIGEILKVCDEKEKLEIDNKILREKIDEYESARCLDENKPVCIGEDKSSFKAKLMFADSIIDDEARDLHESTTENNTLYHSKNESALANYSTYYPDYEKGMTFEKWMSEVDWDSVNQYSQIGRMLKKKFSLGEIKLLYLEAYREVFDFFKKETEEAEKEETEDDNDNAE